MAYIGCRLFLPDNHLQESAPPEQQQQQQQPGCRGRIHHGDRGDGTKGGEEKKGEGGERGGEEILGNGTGKDQPKIVQEVLMDLKISFGSSEVSF